MAGEFCDALEKSVADNSEENIIKDLKAYLDLKSIKFDRLDLAKTLLNIKNIEIYKLSAQLIAESCKTIENREKLCDPDIVKTLLSSLDKEDEACRIQTCRALGNLCYENDSARQFVTDVDGLKTLINIIELNVDSNNSQVLRCASGCLLIYLMSNESAQKCALDLNILKLIERIIAQKIDNFSSTEDLFTHLLVLLNLMSETMVDAWFTPELCIQLSKILELSVDPEISENCLELLHSQGENDDIKFVLAKEGLCELLFNLLEQHKSLVQDDESRALMKLACDLIVLILTGEESMALLYDDGNGKVYKNMLSWMESDNTDLIITGVLSMGNFARNDSHCIKLVESGLGETLLGLLAKHNKPEGLIILQHALLSALKNLVIPAENKARMLKSGIIDIIYPLLSTEQQPVVFKLLGTLRMVIDNQEEAALQLALNVDLLEKLVDWCFNSDHPSVRAEAPRLLAWLIKHCHSSKPLPNMIKTKDCMRCLVEMIPSAHAVMQNEALVALNLLCATNSMENKQGIESNLAQALITADIGKCVTFLLNKCKLEREVFANLLTLLNFLVQTNDIKIHLKDSNLPDALRNCTSQEKLEEYRDKINEMANSIELE